MKCIELFAGAGGLAMGMAKNGFKHEAVIEWDKDACDTIRANQAKKHSIVSDWPLHQLDVRNFDFKTLGNGLDLVAGGPPCQPFSLGGKHQAYLDERDMFPQAARAVRDLEPRAFIIENVRGLTRPSFFQYFSYIQLQLQYPCLVAKRREGWMNHRARLEKYHTRGKFTGTYYRLVAQVINAADYGVPQKRERVVMVGFRADLNIEWAFPQPTHSFLALQRDQWITGDYWDRHEISKKKRPSIPDGLKHKLGLIREQSEAEGLKPWLTVRDAISDLPDPTKGKPTLSFSNHVFNPGARTYPGHTGSPLDLPAKTLKAGAHGVPGGENMLVQDDGTVRYFTVRESARLQTFPDDYVFANSWTEAMRQIGNAVPVRMAEAIGASVAERLRSV